MDELHYQVNLLKAMNQKLSGRDKMFRLVCDTTNNAFLYYSFEKSEVVTLGNWDDHFSFRVKDSKEFVRICEEFEENNAQMLKDVLYLEKSGLERSTVECHIKNGRKWLEFETRVSYDEAGVPTDKIICIRDITKFKNQNDELKYMAYYDSLTGLYNRNYFVMRLGEFVRKAEEEQCVVSVLFIDIDDFRKINDGMGLVIGDEVVQQYGQFLCNFLSENVIVCHMNSDVFCMAIYDPCGSRTVEAIHKKIQERIQKGFVLSNGLELHLTVSIGVAEVNTMYRQMVYQVKHEGMTLEEALPFVTSNVAKALELYPKKGCIAAGSDADLLILNADLTMNGVIAKGAEMMKDGVVIKKGTYEK